MRPNGSIWVFIGPYTFLLVFIGLYASVWVLMSFMHPNGF